MCGASEQRAGALDLGTAKITVVIVDDDRLMRKLVRQALSAAHDMEVVGEAADGLAAIRLIQAVRPRIVVLDIDMPEADGIEVATEIAASVGTTRIVFFTGNQLADVHHRARHLPNYDVVRKHAAHELITAVRSAAHRHG